METYLGEKQQASQWSPYINNGGSCLAVAGDDFAVIASDTRMSLGYSIKTRYSTKSLKITEKCSIVSSGMQADIFTLHKVLKSRAQIYEQKHGKPMSTDAVAKLVSRLLYYRRFFPYYTFNIVAGVDEEGIGCVFSYDAIGTLERVKYSASGSGSSLIEPVLDNQVALKNRNDIKKEDFKLTKEYAIDLVKDAITSAGERDIYTGDFVEISVIDLNGTHQDKFELRFD
ncbi:proteasome subunit beta type-1 [Anaeramoeba flamelloides]|uniref:Proteasome subunit beta n=1 Tax=Anaeramoeba flamelloides TaxID=1746091 RepID=A0AAV8ABX6_9EUKA|nr:proteasome subunit beta type-1 [Anaeramoeba flamelloides]KAJ6249482.1 proteasome subunit beta type-1 [Anaeramoeba flamelloides]